MVSHSIEPAAPRRAKNAAAFDGSSREVLDAIRRIVRSLREASRASERSLGLSAAQLFVLHRLAGAPALSMNELAARTLTHQSSVSVVVGKLRDRGLVACSSSAADARRVEVTLTKQGRAVLERAPAAAPRDRLIAGLALIGERRRRLLAAGLGRLVGAMALADEPAEKFSERAPRRRPLSQRGRRRAVRS